MNAMICRCKHSRSNHDRMTRACRYSFCYCHFGEFTPDDGSLVEPLIQLEA